MNMLLVAAILLIGITDVNSYPIGPSQCDLCQVFVTGGKNFLSYNHTIVELQDYLDVTCDFFGPYRNTCKEFVTIFTPNIISLIDNNHTAVEVCSKTSSCLDYDFLNDFFEDIIEELEAYGPTIDADDDISYEKMNDTKPNFDSLPILFELIDFGEM
jgi:hypothetical protein